VEEFKNYEGAKINYSDTRTGDAGIWIKPHSLLFEKGVKEQVIECFTEINYKAFFKTEGDLPFDVFAASFYLLSRYEEYLPHTKDIYGRYAHENSLAFKENFLQLPLVNIWIGHLKDLLNKKFPLLTTHPPIATGTSFTFTPTYDIDIAWSYNHKGWWRNTGGFLRSIFQARWVAAKDRINTLLGKQKDPFDAYEWMDQLHERHQLKPYYFFLVPEKRSQYDKNISPRCKALQQLIKDHAKQYSIGIHPSWRSGDEPALLKNEIETISNLTGSPVVSSRQHYIRFTLPETFRRLTEHGIRSDLSMGYGSINGFRASVASPYFWYDLEKEEQTDLLLYPFCYMDANSFYEQKLSAEQALEEMRHYYNLVRSVNGHFIMIWHNSFLGTEKLYSGWRAIYEQFIKEVSAP
jgi:hypothetical protein